MNNTVKAVVGMNFQRYEDIMKSDFKEMALRITGLWGHPKADEMYSLAWKHGHEGGEEEVFEHLEDLSAMIFDGRIDC